MRLPLGLRRVEGESMMPLLMPGSIVVITRWYWPLKIGDVVVIEHNGLEKVKRITQLQKKYVFVQGDNKSRSTDSSDFGWLDHASVVAKIVWPRA